MHIGKPIQYKGHFTAYAPLMDAGGESDGAGQTLQAPSPACTRQFERFSSSFSFISPFSFFPLCNLQLVHKAVLVVLLVRTNVERADGNSFVTDQRSRVMEIFSPKLTINNIVMECCGVA